jgi:hypothetical protein
MGLGCSRTSYFVIMIAGRLFYATRRNSKSMTNDFANNGNYAKTESDASRKVIKSISSI